MGADRRPPKILSKLQVTAWVRCDSCGTSINEVRLRVTHDTSRQIEAEAIEAVAETAASRGWIDQGNGYVKCGTCRDKWGS